MTIYMQILLSIWLPYQFLFAPLNASVPDSGVICDFGGGGGGGSGAEGGGGGGGKSLDGIFTFAPFSNDPRTSSTSSLLPPKKSLESKCPPKFPNWSSMSRKSGNSEFLRNGDEGGGGRGLVGAELCISMSSFRDSRSKAKYHKRSHLSSYHGVLSIFTACSKYEVLTRWINF